MMIKPKHLKLDIITYPINQFNLKKWFSSNEIPNHRFLSEI